MECILVWWLVCGLIAGSIYGKKGRSYSRGFAVGFLMGPFGILLAVLSKTDDKELRKRDRKEEEEMILSGEMKRCPACEELIRPEAKVCRHCQSVI